MSARLLLKERQRRRPPFLRQRGECLTEAGRFHVLMLLICVLLLFQRLGEAIKNLLFSKVSPGGSYHLNTNILDWISGRTFCPCTENILFIHAVLLGKASPVFGGAFIFSAGSRTNVFVPKNSFAFKTNWETAAMLVRPFPVCFGGRISPTKQLKFNSIYLGNTKSPFSLLWIGQLPFLIDASGEQMSQAAVLVVLLAAGRYVRFKRSSVALLSNANFDFRCVGL